MAKKTKTEIPEWMKTFYANSAGGSVIDDYKNGRVKTIMATGKTKPQVRKVSEEEKIAEKAYLTAKDNRDAAYWLFTRTKRGQPVPQKLQEEVIKTHEKLMDIRNGRDIGGR